MSESFFTKVANDVLEASELLSIRLEEGLTALLTGQIPKQSSSEGSGIGDNDIEHDQMDEDFGESPLQGIAKSVIGDILENQARPETLMEHFAAFRSAINWSEPFILFLVGFQVVMFLVTLWVSRSGQSFGPRLSVLVIIAVLVRSAEELNKLAAKNWESLATQNYFDQRGVFVSLLFCCPLLLDSFIMLVLLLREASFLLVQVKTREIKKKRSLQQSTRTQPTNIKKEQ